MLPRDSHLWWLHPAVPFAGGSTGLAMAAYLVPAWVYARYWRTPKFFGPDHVLLTLACVMVFCIGVFLTQARQLYADIAVDRDWKNLIPWRSAKLLFHASFYLCVFGYAVWIGAALHRGANWAELKTVLVGEKGALYIFQKDYLGTVSGFSTLTECGIAAVILGCLIGSVKGFRTVRVKLTILLGLAVIRTYFNSERFATIELIVPLIVLSLHLARWTRTQGPLSRLLTGLAPLLGTAGMVLLFTGFEYFRSWTNFYAEEGDLSLLQFGAIRLLGYYATSYNNGAFLIGHEHIHNAAPFFTMKMLWSLPGLSALVRHTFPNLPFDTDDSFLTLLSTRGVNPEFNSADGTLGPLMDFGLMGGLLYWLLIGMVCGSVYKLFCRHDAFGLCFYPFLYLGIIESPLALYWAESKTVPVYGLLACATLLFAIFRRQIRSEPPLDLIPALLVPR